MTIEADVTVIGAYGVGNLGDDALLVSVLKVLREIISDRNICVIVSSKAKYLNRWYPGIRFVPLQEIGRVKTKILLYGGGTQFYSFSGSSLTRVGRVLWAIRYLVNPLKLWRRLLRYKFRFEYSAAISIGIGPFVPDSILEKRAKKKLAVCEWISVRDTSSFEYCRNLGIDNVEQNADLCFARTLWDSTEIQEPRSGKMRRVGIIVRSWPHTSKGWSYFKKLQVAAQRLKQEDLDVCYISFARKADVEMISELTSQGENILQWNPEAYSITSFIDELLKYDLFISARAHGVIMGAALGIPSIAIEVEPKLRLISAPLAGGTEIWSPPFDPDELVHNVFKIRKNWQQYCLSVFSEGLTCASESRRSTEVLKACINKRI
jgi:polysaccharide pyruvyl transferase WcaK-like protein